MTKFQAWLWPNKPIGKRRSGALREEHNALYNAYCELLENDGWVKAGERKPEDEQLVLITQRVKPSLVKCPATVYEYSAGYNELVVADDGDGDSVPYGSITAWYPYPTPFNSEEGE